MEIELKYSIPDADIIDQMWHQEVFEEYGSVDRNSMIPMAATYYDTAEGTLSNVDAAFRIRKEGEHYVATLKWNDTSRDGLFEREELNINLEEEQCRAPTLSIFSESENTRELIDLVGDQLLLPTIRTVFDRHIMRIDTGSSIFEADLDRGTILAGTESLTICELEIELYSGSREEMEKFGKKLADRFGLEPGVKSKFQRGLEVYTEAADRTGR
ncbi:MAG: CYTH domain-containing protein [Firmicutes bacterium]|nr:CYTH domain-containing protein [Bacillota bacterium]